MKLSMHRGWENIGVGMKELFFIEQKIFSAVQSLLTGKVNEILRSYEFQIPLIEIERNDCGYTVNPLILLSACEQTEKERIIKIAAYSISVVFYIPENSESETFCYAYTNAFHRALGEDVTLGGVADKAVITSKKYVPPKKMNCGMEWEAVISLRIALEHL